MTTTINAGEATTDEYRPDGSETPRVWTKPLRKLTPDTSKGFEATAFAETILGLTLLPWQKWLLIHVLELLPSGKFRFRKVILLIARQNGKTTIAQILILWKLFMDGAELVIGTAQNLDVAARTWEECVDLIQDNDELRSWIPVRRGIIRKNGSTQLRLIDPDTFTSLVYTIQANKRTGGRSLSADFLFFDEFREQLSWDAYGALTKTQTARPDPQMVAASNAGDAASVPLWSLRKKAHYFCGDPDGLYEEDDEVPEFEQSLGIFEWSAPPGCSVWDRDGWALANPSLGYTISHETIASDAATDPEAVFRTETLCQWVLKIKAGMFQDGEWEAGLDTESQIAPDSRYAFCVDVSWVKGLPTTHIAVAGWRPDGHIHVEVMVSRPGTAWATGWLKRRGEDKALIGVAYQENGAPVSALATDLEKIEVGDDPRVPLPLIPWSGPSLSMGTQEMRQSVSNTWIASKDQEPPESDTEEQGRHWYHLDQPALNAAASFAVAKKFGDSMFLDRSASPIDISPLVACTGAAWALVHADDPVVSAYDDGYDE